MQSGFWNGGPEAYCQGLKQEYKLQMSVLQQQLHECANELQRDEIHTRIETTKKEYRDKGLSIRNLIF